VDVTEFIRLYPKLFHMAEPGSWGSIAERGLLTTAALVDLFEVGPELSAGLLERRRPTKVALDHPRHGRVVIRDQKPLSTSKLERCLTDMSVVEWLASLNNRVFLWLQPQRLSRLLNARAYRNEEHDVLVVDTRRLLDLHLSDVRLSRINSGSTAYNAVPRGTDTFRSLADYPHPQRRQALAAASDIAELAVLGGVPEIVKVVDRVERRRGDACLEVLWNS
jgi:hypothetical protein